MAGNSKRGARVVSQLRGGNRVPNQPTSTMTITMTIAANHHAWFGFVECGTIGLSALNPMTIKKMA